VCWFSPAFAEQIESKVVAYQKYLTEQNNLLAVKVIANQTVVQAQAAARSNVVKLMVSLRQSRS
jgi:prohibitin 2